MRTHPAFQKLRIFAPGPTPVPEEVLAAMSMAPLHHRTPAFIEILQRVRENLKFLFGTNQPCYLLTASGTGAMEATVVNLFSARDEVIVVNGGKFGERWTKVAQRFGLQVHEIKVEWGDAVRPEAVTAALTAHPAARAVLLQASETSTGAAHPVKEVAAAVHAQGDALVIVDAITATGVLELPMDAWGLDVVLSGSQKALMLPPGLAFLALSPRAHAARKRATLPRFYFDLDAEDKSLATGETAWTPAVNLIMGLDVVLLKMRKTGLEPIYRHHARLAEGTRRGVKAMGLGVLAKTHPAPSLTAALLPSGIDGKAVITSLRDQCGITVAEGQDAYKGKMFRIAHLGYFDELDMLTVLAAIELTLKKLGHGLELGHGVGAASRYFFENE